MHRSASGWRGSSAGRLTRLMLKLQSINRCLFLLESHISKHISCHLEYFCRWQGLQNTL